jgi:hypothetical protein
LATTADSIRLLQDADSCMLGTPAPSVTGKSGVYGPLFGTAKPGLAVALRQSPGKTSAPAGDRHTQTDFGLPHVVVDHAFTVAAEDLQVPVQGTGERKDVVQLPGTA